MVFQKDQTGHQLCCFWSLVKRGKWGATFRGLTQPAEIYLVVVSETSSGIFSSEQLLPDSL